MKFAQFKDAFAHQLTANLQAAVFADPTLRASPGDAIELTLAGYDLDGSLKVGEVTLTAETTPSGVVFKAGDLPERGLLFQRVSLEENLIQTTSTTWKVCPSLGSLGMVFFVKLRGLSPNQMRVSRRLREYSVHGPRSSIARPASIFRC
jgi:hypothetical protein